MSFDKAKSFLGKVRGKVVPLMDRAHQVSGIVVCALAVHESVAGVGQSITKLRKRFNKDASR